MRFLLVFFPIMVVHAGLSMSKPTQPPTLPRESLYPEDITQANKLSQKLMEIWDKTAIQITPYEDTKTIRQDDQLMLYKNRYWFESLIPRIKEIDAEVKAQIRRPLPSSFANSGMWKKFEPEREQLKDRMNKVDDYMGDFRDVTNLIGDTMREIAQLRRYVANLLCCDIMPQANSIQSQIETFQTGLHHLMSNLSSKHSKNMLFAETVPTAFVLACKSASSSFTSSEACLEL